MKKLKFKNIIAGVLFTALLFLFWDFGYTYISKPGWYNSENRVQYFKDKLRGKIYFNSARRLLFGSTDLEIEIDDMVMKRESCGNLKRMIYVARETETPSFIMSGSACANACMSAKECLTFLCVL